MNVRDAFDDGNDHEPPGADVQAGEYVLGVLDAPERRQAQARIGAEPAFARLVEEWEQRLAAWLDAIAPVAPPPQLWPRIRTRLGWAPVAGARKGMWQNLNVWRGATATAVAAAAALAVVSFLQPPPQIAPRPAPMSAPVAVVATLPEQPRPVVVLARDDGSPGWLAAVDATHGEVTMMPMPSPDVADGSGCELWLIPAGGAPQSLGLVSSEMAHTVKVPPALRDALASGTMLAVTLEPMAGMPHAAPTGPMIAKGSIQST